MAEVDKVEDREEAAALRADLEPAAAAAREALEGFGSWLSDHLLPQALRDFRLGSTLYRDKFRHALRGGDAADRAAGAGAGRVRPRPRRDAPAGDRTVADLEGRRAHARTARRASCGVLDAIAAVHPAAEELLDFCRAENERIETFCRDIGLIGLADEPMEIMWTPSSSAPSVGPCSSRPARWTAACRASSRSHPCRTTGPMSSASRTCGGQRNGCSGCSPFTRRCPAYLQLAYSNRCPSLVRAIFQSGVFEGWAVYVTRVMMDVGYGSDDPALMLVHWKFYLRRHQLSTIDGHRHSHRFDGP